RIHENQISVKRGNFQTNYELWTKIFDFFNDLILKNFNEKIYRKKFNIAKNKTLIYLITICPDFSYFFKILKSKYFVFNVAKPKQWLKLISKFIKLIFKV
ncbi:MAG: hypothetical protein M1409_10220, partial [Actinobacteria bacterium]|nr:hypothetical protein [Actinomycetota bacterium]